MSAPTRAVTLDEFRARTTELLDGLGADGSALILTLDDEEVGVVLSHASYRALLARAGMTPSGDRGGAEARGSEADDAAARRDDAGSTETAP